MYTQMLALLILLCVSMHSWGTEVVGATAKALKWRSEAAFEMAKEPVETSASIEARLAEKRRSGYHNEKSVWRQRRGKVDWENLMGIGISVYIVLRTLKDAGQVLPEGYQDFLDDDPKELCLPRDEPEEKSLPVSKKEELQYEKMCGFKIGETVAISYCVLPY